MAAAGRPTCADRASRSRAVRGDGDRIGPMTDTTTDPNVPAAPAAPADPGVDAADGADGAAPFDPQRRATELAILDALRAVVDPEIGMNVVELALIKQIILGPDSTEVKMILTTPFCPYAGSMIQQVKDQAESVVEHDVKVTLLAERWDPRDAGLMW
jgi:metal-sulfur cluster biosynthetic enzyme